MNETTIKYQIKPVSKYCKYSTLCIEDVVCKKYGFCHGDLVRYKKDEDDPTKYGWVVGVYEDDLYIHWVNYVVTKHTADDPELVLVAEREKFVDWTKFLNDEDFTDIEFFVDDEIVTGHRIVFASYSEKLKDLLKDQKTVTIADLSVSNFETVKKFIYTGDCDINKDNILSIYKFAKKYDITDLIKYCAFVKFPKSLVDDLDLLFSLMTISFTTSDCMAKSCFQYIAANYQFLRNDVMFIESLKKSSNECVAGLLLMLHPL